jgi:hypothetical protein
MIVRNENHMLIELRLRDPFQRRVREREAVAKALAESPWERGYREVMEVRHESSGAK